MSNELKISKDYPKKLNYFVLDHTHLNYLRTQSKINASGLFQ